MTARTLTKPAESIAEPATTDVEVVPIHNLPSLPPAEPQRALVLMPATSIDGALERYQALVGFVQKLLKPDMDFGVIPGTNAKPVLLKPGAEKLCMFFGLRSEFLLVDTVKDWDRGIFYFEYKCRLWRGDYLAGEGVGSANSKEKKYRYRNSERVCPVCGKTTIIKGKAEYGGGWVCFAKKGGCGEKFHEKAPEIIDQEVGQIENPEPFEIVNTLQKMAQKRAFMGAVILTVNASEFFTQDLEDFNHGDAANDPPAAKAKEAPQSRQQPASGAGAAQGGQSAATGQQGASGGNGEAMGEWLPGLVSAFKVVNSSAEGKKPWWDKADITINGRVYSAMLGEKTEYIGKRANDAIQSGERIEFKLERSKDKKYVNIVDLRVIAADSENNPANYTNEEQFVGDSGVRGRTVPASEDELAIRGNEQMAAAQADDDSQLPF